jgi:hypothetical protein
MPFVRCPRCGKKFKDETNLLQHMNQPFSSCLTHFEECINIATALQSVPTISENDDKVLNHPVSWIQPKTILPHPFQHPHPKILKTAEIRSISISILHLAVSMDVERRLWIDVTRTNSQKGGKGTYTILSHREMNGS